MTTSATGPLEGIRILDLSRVLAGPSCTQLLADLGADVVKVERPGIGDETRAWGPPFLKGADGKDTTESGYYLSANRNKRSAAVNLAKPEGAALIRRMLPRFDVLIENFKVGGLQDYASSSSMRSSPAWSTVPLQDLDRRVRTLAVRATT
jgi:glutaryl-CoA transferase